MKAAFVIVLTFISVTAFAQKPYNWSDSTKGNGKYSYFDINIGSGNTAFTPRRPNPKKQEYDQLYYFAGAGYYHKSGLNLSLQSFATKEEGSVILYQTMLTAAYDYEKYNYEKKQGIGFGVSYTRLLNRDSLTFYLSPLKNQYSAYVKWMNKIITPEVSFTYGTGKASVVRVFPLPPRRVDIKANEYNVSLNLSHEFWIGDQNKREQTLEPYFSVFAGQNEYGGLNPRQRKTAARSSDESFQVLDMILGLKYVYTFNDLYIQPELMLDYYYPKANSKFYPMFSVTVGYEFW